MLHIILRRFSCRCLCEGRHSKAFLSTKRIMCVSLYAYLCLLRNRDRHFVFFFSLICLRLFMMALLSTFSTRFCVDFFLREKFLLFFKTFHQLISYLNFFLFCFCYNLLFFLCPRTPQQHHNSCFGTFRFDFCYFLSSVLNFLQAIFG